jgi:hypothetical protein
MANNKSQTNKVQKRQRILGYNVRIMTKIGLQNKNEKEGIFCHQKALKIRD